jgi:hypothetical protein
MQFAYSLHCRRMGRVLRMAWRFASGRWLIRVRRFVGRPSVFCRMALRLLRFEGLPSVRSRRSGALSSLVILCTRTTTALLRSPCGDAVAGTTAMRWGGQADVLDRAAARDSAADRRKLGCEQAEGRVIVEDRMKVLHLSRRSGRSVLPARGRKMPLRLSERRQTPHWARTAASFRPRSHSRSSGGGCELSRPPRLAVGCVADPGVSSQCDLRAG